MASSASRTLLRPTTPLGERQNQLIGCLRPLPETFPDMCPSQGCSQALCQVT